MTKLVSQTLQMTHRFIMGGQPTYALSALHIFSRVRPRRPAPCSSGQSTA